MFSKLSTAAALLALLNFLAPAQAAIVGFEDIPMTHTATPGYEYAYLSNQYGLNWSGGLQEISWTVSPATGVWFSGTQAHSGTNFAWSNGGTNLSISASNNFSLEEFWARSANTVNDIELAVTAFRNGAVVDTKLFTVTNTYQLMTVSFKDVDFITLTPGTTANLLFDDLVLTLPVPEPQTYLMLLAGLGLIGLAVRLKSGRRMKPLIKFAALLLIALASTSRAQAASHLDSPIDPAVIVRIANYEWVWAAPCAPTGQSCGTVVLRDNFVIPTAAQWHLSFGSNDALVSAFVQNGVEVCAAPWFSSIHDHCDKQDLIDGYVWGAPAPIGNSRNYDPAAESFLVRAVPEPETYAMLLAGFGLIGLAKRRTS